MNQLRGMIYQKFPTQKACSDALRWPKQKLSNIVLGKTMPTVKEAEELSVVLGQSIKTVTDAILGSFALEEDCEDEENAS